MKLFKYQETGRDFLLNHDRALLADEMGLGKTPQAVTAFKDLKKVLVICPSVAKFNWQKEIKVWSGRESFVCERGELPKPRATSKIWIMSFNHATKYLQKLKTFDFDCLIIDEWHYLKEPSAARTRAIIGTDGIIHKSKKTWALTGTPAPNHAGELWTLLYNFGLTSMSYQGFIDRYCNVYQVGNHYGRTQISGTNTLHAKELKEMLAKCSIRRKKKDELDLPPMFHSQYNIAPDTKAVFGENDLKKLMQEEFRIITEKLGENMELPTDEKLIPTLEFLSQSISALRKYHGLKKIYPVANLIREELNAGLYDKIVLFGIHKTVLGTVENFLNDAKIKTVRVDGGCLAMEKFEKQNIFQDDPETKVFLGNIEAAGTNLTLTAANQVGFIEQDWVPGNNAQAADRTHRIGQREAVTCRHFSIKDSLDEKITASLTRKIQEISTFIS